MSELEKKKLEVEYQRVKSARMELELRKLEREEEIERIVNHIKVQVEAEAALLEKLK